MAILVVGASGETGRLLVEQFLIQRHQVKNSCKIYREIARFLEK